MIQGQERELIRPTFDNRQDLRRALERFVYDGNPDNYDNIGTWNVSNIRSFQNLFSGLIITDEDNERIAGINDWVVNNVVNMSYMFTNCTHFNQPLNNWRFSANLQTLQSMFFNCSLFNQPLDNWNISPTTTPNLESTNSMFMRCISFNQDLSNWDLSHVPNRATMFRDTQMEFNTNFHPRTATTANAIRIAIPTNPENATRAALRNNHPVRPVPPTAPPTAPPTVPRPQQNLNPRRRNLPNDHDEVHRTASEIDEVMMDEVSELIKQKGDTCIKQDQLHKFIIDSFRTIITFLPDTSEFEQFKGVVNNALEMIKKQRLDGSSCFLPDYKLCFIYYIIKYLLTHHQNISPEELRMYLQSAIVDSTTAYTGPSPMSCVGGIYERIYLAFFHLVQFSTNMVKNDPRLEGVVEWFNIPDNQNLNNRLHNCLKNFARSFKGKHEFYDDRFDLDRTTMPSDKEIIEWLKQCVRTAYPKKLHEAAIDAYFEKHVITKTIEKDKTERIELSPDIKDLVSEAYLKHNIPIQVVYCLNHCPQTTIPTWEVSKNWIKNCLLEHFGEEYKPEIDQYLVSHQDQIMNYIRASVNERIHPREYEEEEKEEYFLEKTENGRGNGRGKKRTRKAIRKQNHKKSHQKNSRKTKNKKNKQKIYKRKTNKKRYTRR